MANKDFQNGFSLGLTVNAIQTPSEEEKESILAVVHPIIEVGIPLSIDKDGNGVLEKDLTAFFEENLGKTYLFIIRDNKGISVREYEGKIKFRSTSMAPGIGDYYVGHWMFKTGSLYAVISEELDLHYLIYENQLKIRDDCKYAGTYGQLSRDAYDVPFYGPDYTLDIAQISKIRQKVQIG